MQAARKIEKETDKALSAYALTNGHRRRVLMHVNARELYHIARLRCDAHAQWEIRRLAEEMLSLAKAVWPNLLALCCGKDVFKQTYDEFMKSK